MILALMVPLILVIYWKKIKIILSQPVLVLEDIFAIEVQKKNVSRCHDKSLEDEEGKILGNKSMEEKAGKHMAEKGKRGKKNTVQQDTLAANEKPKKVISKGGEKIDEEAEKEKNIEDYQ
jgi:hypothetical protein